MKKRLAAAFLIVGTISATLLLGASTFWTTGDASIRANAASGEASLSIAANGTLTGTATCDTRDGACELAITPTGIYPGWSQAATLVIENTGDVALDVILQNGGWTESSALLGALQLDLSGAVAQSGPVNDNAYQAGITLATDLAPGESVTVNAELAFPSTAENQNDLQNQTTQWVTTIFGRSK